MARTHTEVSPSVELDRAVGAAIGRLTRHLDAEQSVADRAAATLLEIGPYAAASLAAAFGDPGRRTGMS